MRAMSAMDSRSGRKPARRFRCTYWLRFSTAASAMAIATPCEMEVASDAPATSSRGMPMRP